MTIWTNKSLSEALNIEVTSNFSLGNIIQFNSKDLNPGDIFIALQGDKGNGHDYVVDAINKGAACAIVERYIPEAEGKCVIVKDTAIALKQLAQYKRQKSKAIFLAITGSAGKTSIKEWLLYTLSNFDKTIASRNSFNNILGISLDLASMADDAKYAIFEVGMNHSGEIREMIPYIKPDIALINNILPTHIGHFESLKLIADAKLEILEGLNENGAAIFNKNNDYYNYSFEKAKELGVSKIFSFGDAKYGQKADSLLEEYDTTSHIINIDNKRISFTTKIGGRHRILNLAAILLICKILNLDLEQTARNFINLEEPKGRGRIRETKYNNKLSIIIDDAYNASPATVIESLNHFTSMKHKYKVAILGDMRELGSREIEYHKELLPHIINANINKIHTVGPLMYELHKILPEQIRGNHFIDYIEIQNNLQNIINQDMMILLKASKGMKLWHIVDILLNELKV